MCLLRFTAETTTCDGSSTPTVRLWIKEVQLPFNQVGQPHIIRRSLARTFTGRQAELLAELLILQLAELLVLLLAEPLAELLAELLVLLLVELLAELLVLLLVELLAEILVDLLVELLADLLDEILAC